MTVAIRSLATQITKWSAEADPRLNRLLCYIDSRPEQVLSRSLATTDFADVQVWAWPDADLAGDIFSTKSTGGRWIELVGKDGRCMPLSWACRRQGATAGHTQEADTLSLAQCLREEALSLQTFVQEVLRKPVPFVVKDNNSACSQAIRKGYLPTLRYRKRTQRASVVQFHEALEERDAEQSEDGQVTLEHSATKSHKGDVFTKYMLPATCREGLGRLGVTQRRTRLAGGAARVLESRKEYRRQRRRRTRGALRLRPRVPLTYLLQQHRLTARLTTHLNSSSKQGATSHDNANDDASTQQQQQPHSSPPSHVSNSSRSSSTTASQATDQQQRQVQESGRSSRAAAALEGSVLGCRSSLGEGSSGHEEVGGVWRTTARCTKVVDVSLSQTIVKGRLQILRLIFHSCHHLQLSPLLPSLSSLCRRCRRRREVHAQDDD